MSSILSYRNSRELVKPNNTIIESLDWWLHESSRTIGKVFRGLLDGKGQDQIRVLLQYPKGNETVHVFSRVIKALRGNIEISRLKPNDVLQMVYAIKQIQKSCNDDQLEKYLNAKLEEADGNKTGKDRAETILSGAKKLNPSKSKEGNNSKVVAESAPGVYIYSYPKYLKEGEKDDDHVTYYKIGKSRNVADRIKTQNRETSVPEDIEIIDVFYTADPVSLENNIHRVLHSLGLHHKSKKGGVEWFVCSVTTIRAIVQTLKLQDRDRDKL